MTTTTSALIKDELVREAAERAGACVRPILQRLHDNASNASERIVAMPCGSTKDKICPSCAAKARKVRMQQAREGWHRTEEAPTPGGIPAPDVRGMTEPEARETCAEAGMWAPPLWGIDLIVDEHRHNLNADPGTVLEQTPRPGAYVGLDVPVRVVVAAVTSGESGVVMPDLHGLPVAEARDVWDELVRSGPPLGGNPLAVDAAYYDSEMTPGTVIDQTPKADLRTDLDVPVRVVLASRDRSDRRSGLPKWSRLRRRSTARRTDFPKLPPSLDPSDRTVGKTITSPTGKTYQPSMFLTLTLDSYGPVRDDGTPYNPNNYDYARAARDAMLFPKLLDQFWKLLTRCAGYKVQHFAVIEPQKRLALHMHAAVRGVIPTATLTALVEATYDQVWWPQIHTPVYAGDHLPEWDPIREVYVHPGTDLRLDRFEDAALDADEPAHLLYFGKQFDRQWFIPNTTRSDKRIGYLAKYLTKSIADTYDEDGATARQREHRDRLMGHIKWLPCSETCANWLRFGVQPKDAEAGMRPGECDKPAHHPDNLGHGGQRVYTSGQWSGKTVAKHRADRAQVVKAALAEAGIEMPDTQRFATDQTDDDGNPRYRWEPIDMTKDAHAHLYRDIITATVAERIRWTNQYQAAKLAAAQAADHAYQQARARPPDDSRTHRRWAKSTRQTNRSAAALAA